MSCILSKSWGIPGRWIGRQRWIFIEEGTVSTNIEVATALRVLGTIGRLVRLGHKGVRIGNLGKGDRRKQGTDHKMSCRLCRGT